MSSAQDSLEESRPRWQRRKDARPTEIAQAALELFVERGFSATKLEDVARKAGVSKGTMYLYFESKDALFKAAVRQSLVASIERGEQLTEQFRGTTPQLVAAMLRFWWQSIGESPASGLPKLMVAEARNFPELTRWYFEEVIQRGQALAARVLQRGIDRGEFRPMRVDIAVRLAISPLIQLALWKHSFNYCDPNRADPRAVVEQHVEFFLRAIAAESREDTHGA